MKQTTIRPLVTASLVAMALSACGGAPKKIDSLEQARTAYSEASSDVVVAKHAPTELDAAKAALVRADAVWKDDGKRSRVDHYAYLTSRRVEIAKLIAESKEAESTLESMKLERQRVQLDLRATELDRTRVAAEEAKAEAVALQKQMEDLQAKNTERGMVLTLGDVLFDSGEATLKPGAARNIDRIAEFMLQYPERDAIVEGHTDNMGDEDFNMDLSQERAFSVRTALVNRGVSPKRITTRGFGEAVPIASNADASGRQANRRVELIFPDSQTQVSQLSQ